MRPAIILTIISFTLLTGFKVADSPNWVFRKYESGVTVYTRSSSNNGDIKEILIVDTVQSTLSAIVGLLNDTKNYPNWIDHCSYAATLKVVSPQEQYKYERIDVPWPFSDRDFATHFKVWQDSVTKVVNMLTVGAPDYIPLTDGVVRIRHFYSAYKLIPMPNNKVRIEFELDVDPTGKVPAWLINANIVSGPFATAVATIKELPKYQSTVYPFIKEK